VEPEPVDVGYKHLIFNILEIAQESYSEFIYKKLPKRNW
jgi:hypothetical protein